MKSRTFCFKHRLVLQAPFRRKTFLLSCFVNVIENIIFKGKFIRAWQHRFWESWRKMYTLNLSSTSERSLLSSDNWRFSNCLFLCIELKFEACLKKLFWNLSESYFVLKHLFQNKDHPEENILNLYLVLKSIWSLKFSSDCWFFNLHGFVFQVMFMSTTFFPQWILLKIALGLK